MEIWELCDDDGSSKHDESPLFVVVGLHREGWVTVMMWRYVDDEVVVVHNQICRGFGLSVVAFALRKFHGHVAKLYTTWNILEEQVAEFNSELPHDMQAETLLGVTSDEVTAAVAAVMPRLGVAQATTWNKHVAATVRRRDGGLISEMDDVILNMLGGMCVAVARGRRVHAYH